MPFLKKVTTKRRMNLFRKEFSTRKVLKAIKDPFDRFFSIEASGGILLLIATVVALVWANSPWKENYHHFWEVHLSFELGSFHLSKSIHHWINDGLMAIFFFVVGLEIKREVLVGELSSVKKSSLPIAAALGGMVIPALLYTMLNESPDTASGWGVPMATDIAFSLGILNLLGKRVPLSLKVFLVAFAIVDDIGAVLVIAFFYSTDIQTTALMIAGILFMLLILLNRLHVRSIHVYMIIGWVVWYYFLISGIHPTLAGVLIAFTIPVKRKINIRSFRKSMEENLKPFCIEGCEDKMILTHAQVASVDNIKEEVYYVQSPLQSLEHRLHGFVTFIVMPLFALANAGVTFQGVEGAGIFKDLSLQIETSLIIGKVIGIFLFTFLSIKFRLASMPQNVKWVHILGIGFLGGIGFTMSLFIANLAFRVGTNLDPAKLGILVGSLIAGVVGYLILRYTLKRVD